MDSSGVRGGSDGDGSGPAAGRATSDTGGGLRIGGVRIGFERVPYEAEEVPRVPRSWPGATIVILAGGPSLTREDVEHCRGRAVVLAINDAYRLAPWADVLYAADSKWWSWHDGVPGFTGPKYCLQPDAKRWAGVEILRNTGIEGFESDPGGVKAGLNSGYQAINVAAHMGAARVLLLGYDMQGEDGRTHWFGDHPWGGASRWETFIPQFRHLVEPLRARGIEVLNCTRRTALSTFPRVPLAEALP